MADGEITGTYYTNVRKRREVEADGEAGETESRNLRHKIENLLPCRVLQ